jgi:hypothetical protein
MYPVYRKDVSTPCAFPQNQCRTMAPQIFQYRRIVGHHFARRHKGHRAACKSWIAGMRRDLAACGWSANAKACNAAMVGGGAQ